MRGFCSNATVGLQVLIVFLTLAQGGMQQETVAIPQDKDISHQKKDPTPAAEVSVKPDALLSSVEGHCYAKLEDEECEAECPCSRPASPQGPSMESASPDTHKDDAAGQDFPKDHTAGDEYSSPGVLLRQGVEEFVDRMERSGAEVMQRIEGVVDQVVHSKDRMMEGIDKVMDKMAESKDSMMKGLDNVIDKMAHSKMMKELDHVIDKVAHSKVMEEIRALPEAMCLAVKPISREFSLYEVTEDLEQFCP